MKITAAHITNFKRIQDIRIEPEADRSLVLIGGKNAQGKSSLMDALTAAFGGKKAAPADPVRHGAESAEIVVELDGGELLIKREIAPDGSSVIEVRDRFGAVKQPQTILDKLVGARFLDPLQFLKLPAKEQRAQLMKLIDGAERIAGLNEKRARAFERRTDVGRELTKAEGELARLPVLQVGAPIDVAELTAEARRIAEQQRRLAELKSDRERAERVTQQLKQNLASAAAEIERLKSRLAAVEAEHAELSKGIAESAAVEAESTRKVDDAIDAWNALQPRREALEADLARAGEHNRAVYAAEAQEKRRTEVAADVEKLRTERETITKLLETIDQRKAEILAGSKLPVAGLGVADEGIELGGVPFSQSSGAEQLRVAVALAIAASPQLDDIWVRDAALLDDESLAAVAEQAAAAGKRLWLERVGDRDPGVIVIRDGKVVAS